MTRLALACFAVATVLSFTPSARAGEAQIDTGPTLRASTWRGDYGIGGQLRLGYRFAKIIAIDFVGWEEYESVDKRANTGLTAGLSGFLPLTKLRPFARIYFIHQHEEGLVSVEDHPVGTVFGVGAGIRHRAGGGASLGLEIPFSKSKQVEYLAVASGSVTWFPDQTLGPPVYFGLTGGIGLNYSIAGLP